MTREDFYKEICKLAPSEYDANKRDFPEHLENILNSYYKLLDELDESERPDVGFATWEETKTMIRELKDAINESVALYYEGCHSAAFRRLRDVIKKKYLHTGKWKKEETIEQALDSSDRFKGDFYRMRIFEEGEKHDRNGMFHIPFNKRTVVKTQRYSAPGYPCLYLGASVYVCWEEMQRPNLDKCYVSRFHTEGTYVCDLSFPSIKDMRKVHVQYSLDYNEQNLIFLLERNFRYILLRLPLVLACMVKVAKPNDPFKPEYIIPQLLMEWVIEEEKLKKANDGIAYTSVQKSGDFDFDSEKSINLVFPAFPPFKGNYSKKLCNMFKVTEPTCDELERAKCPYQAVEIDKKKRKRKNKKYNYQISTFGQLEERLKDEEKFPLKKIDNSTFGS